MQQTLFEMTDRFLAWQRFHQDNPQVFELFRQFALEAYFRGVRKLGARILGERIRWQAILNTSDPAFKINNNHLPYYARLLAGTDGRFAEFFSFRGERFDATVDEIVTFHRGLAQ